MIINSRSLFQWATVLILFCSFPAGVFAWPVPDTGQTACYDDAGNIISCPSAGLPFYGQDGNYTINPMSFTKLNAAGKAMPADESAWVMVRDNVTGLIWEVKQDKDGVENYVNPHDADNVYTWYDSNPATNGGNAGTPGQGTDTEDFINALNTDRYGGYNDWRLPTARELESIIDCGTLFPAPSINATFFPNTAASWYRSSTTMADEITVPIDVSFFYGLGVYYFSKAYAYSARAVRGEGVGKPLNVQKNGTVTDPESGLMWQQAAPAGTFNWQQALDYAESLSLAGHQDWRLPTIKELQTIANFTGDPAFTRAFPDMMNPSSSPFLSSTSWPPDSSYVWAVSFGQDIGQPYLKGDPGKIRVVRGGKAGSDNDNNRGCFIRTIHDSGCR